MNVKIADLARVVAPLESPRWQPCRPPMIVAATLAPASAQPPHGNATKRGRSVVTAEVVKPAKRLVAVAVAPSQPVPATVVAAAKPRACVVAVRSSACTSVATATREEQAERLEQQLERLREEQQRRRQAEQARGLRRLRLRLHREDSGRRVSCRYEHRRLADRPRLGRLLCRRAARQHPPEPIRLGRDHSLLGRLVRARRAPARLRRVRTACTSDAKIRCHCCCCCLGGEKRRVCGVCRGGGRAVRPAAMRKDGVAAPQARSVARAPRPPSSVQRTCLTELGSRFAQCAAAGRRGYCRPAASSSAAARGSRLQHGTRPMCAHACSALSAASLRRWRCPVAATVAALPEFFAGTLGDPSVRGPV